MTITAQLPDLFPDDSPEPPVSLAAQAVSPDGADPVPAAVGAPVPDDPVAISMYTAHRLDDTGRHLAHATERMTAARAATGELRAYHSGHVAFHLQRALDNGHRLVANIRAHYPAEAAELEQVKQAVGLAKSLTPGIKAATTAHLLETTLHEETHGVRHAQAMGDTEPDDVWEFNADHCEKHLGGAVEHAGKLAQHFRDNYPDVARWLDGLDEIASPAEEDGDGKPQHARYAKSAGTVSVQMANGETISGQAGNVTTPSYAGVMTLAAWEHETRDSHGKFFHGTSAALKPGDLIETGHPATSRHRQLENVKGLQGRYAHMSTDVKVATRYAQRAASVARNRVGRLKELRDKNATEHVYEVKPLGPVEPDPDGRPATDYRSGRPLRVVREVQPEYDLSNSNTISGQVAGH